MRRTKKFPTGRRAGSTCGAWPNIWRWARIRLPPAICTKNCSLYLSTRDTLGPNDSGLFVSELWMITDWYGSGGTDLMRKFVTRLRTDASNLLAFLRLDDMDSANNLAEHVLRSVAIQRKARGHPWIISGMHAMSVLLACIGTWKMQNKRMRVMLTKRFSAGSAQMRS